MNDRELLELAAKAARVKHPAGIRSDGTWWWYNSTQDGEGLKWNPLTDDGDALRLAVVLGLDVDIHRAAVGGDPCGVEVRGYVYRRLLITEPAIDNGALLAATRRAIVRAAAEIGRAMP